LRPLSNGLELGSGELNGVHLNNREIRRPAREHLAWRVSAPTKHEPPACRFNRAFPNALRSGPASTGSRTIFRHIQKGRPATGVFESRVKAARWPIQAPLLQIRAGSSWRFSPCHQRAGFGSALSTAQKPSVVIRKASRRVDLISQRVSP